MTTDLKQFAKQPRKWWQHYDVVVNVAVFAYDEGELTTAKEILHFFAKPWHYDRLYMLWDEDQSRRGEAQDEFNLREP